MVSFLSKNIIQIIWGSAILCGVLLIFSFIFALIIRNKIKSKSEKDFKKVMYYLLDIPYTIVIALISIFPLLGMLGTVVALLSEGDNAELLKNNFFQALDTTMLGIVFAAIYKFVNSLVQTFIESQISKAKKLLEKSYESE